MHVGRESHWNQNPSRASWFNAIVDVTKEGVPTQNGARSPFMMNTILRSRAIHTFHDMIDSGIKQQRSRTIIFHVTIFHSELWFLINWKICNLSFLWHPWSKRVLFVWVYGPCSCCMAAITSCYYCRVNIVLEFYGVKFPGTNLRIRRHFISI